VISSEDKMPGSTSDSQWDWRRLPAAAQRARWAELAAWVEWLQDNYQSWVRLPPCWPRHEALRSELVFFKAWREDVLLAGSGYDGVNWHSQLRAAAVEWEPLVDCRHEDAPWNAVRSPEYAAAFSQHLAIASNQQPESQRENRGPPSQPARPRFSPPNRSFES